MSSTQTITYPLPNIGRDQAGNYLVDGKGNFCLVIRPPRIVVEFGKYTGTRQDVKVVVNGTSYVFSSSDGRRNTSSILFDIGGILIPNLRNLPDETTISIFARTNFVADAGWWKSSYEGLRVHWRGQRYIASYVLAWPQCSDDGDYYDMGTVIINKADRTLTLLGIGGTSIYPPEEEEAYICGGGPPPPPPPPPYEIIIEGDLMLCAPDGPTVWINWATGYIFAEQRQVITVRADIGETDKGAMSKSAVGTIVGVVRNDYIVVNGRRYWKKSRFKAKRLDPMRVYRNCLLGRDYNRFDTPFVFTERNVRDGTTNPEHVTGRVYSRAAATTGECTDPLYRGDLINIGKDITAVTQPLQLTLTRHPTFVGDAGYGYIVPTGRQVHLEWHTEGGGSSYLFTGTWLECRTWDNRIGSIWIEDSAWNTPSRTVVCSSAAPELVYESTDPDDGTVYYQLDENIPYGEDGHPTILCATAGMGGWYFEATQIIDEEEVTWLYSPVVDEHLEEWYVLEWTDHTITKWVSLSGAIYYTLDNDTAVAYGTVEDALSEQNGVNISMIDYNKVQKVIASDGTEYVPCDELSISGNRTIPQFDLEDFE